MVSSPIISMVMFNFFVHWVKLTFLFVNKYDCHFYRTFTNACFRWGDKFKNFGFTANGACCVCGGGKSTTHPSISPTSIPSSLPSNTSSQSPSNSPTLSTSPTEGDRIEVNFIGKDEGLRRFPRISEYNRSSAAGVQMLQYRTDVTSDLFPWIGQIFPKEISRDSCTSITCHRDGIPRSKRSEITFPLTNKDIDISRKFDSKHLQDRTIYPDKDGEFVDCTEVPCTIVAVGDLNGDGISDLMVVKNSTSMHIFTGHRDKYFIMGNGTTIPEYNELNGDEMQLSDIDGRNGLDVVSKINGLIYTFLNNGGGTFVEVEQKQMKNKTNCQFSLGHMNDDDHVDLILACPNGEGWSTDIEVLMNNGKGTFNAAIMDNVDINGITRMEAIHFDSNDIFGLCISNESSILFLRNGGSDDALLTLEPQKIMDFAPLHFNGVPLFKLADINGDGFVDLVTVDSNGESKLLLWGARQKKFDIVNLPATTGKNTVSIALGDLNGDGLVDLVFGQHKGKKDEILLNEGDGIFNKSLYLPKSDTLSGNLILGDFDKDGSTDVLYKNDLESYDTSRVYFGQGQYHIKYHDNTIPTGFVATGDLNGDGYEDLVIGNIVGSDRIFFSDGSGSFRENSKISGSEKTITHQVLLADLNDDTYPDIIAGTEHNGVRIYLNSGSVTDDNFDSSEIELDYDVIAIGDMNLDLSIDIVHLSKGSLYILENDGTGSFQTSTSIDVDLDFEADNNKSRFDKVFLELADLNHDGKLDIVVAKNHSYYLLLSTSSTKTTGPYEVFKEKITDGFITDIALGDLDNDGDIDAVFAIEAGESKIAYNIGNFTEGDDAVQRHFIELESMIHLAVPPDIKYHAIELADVDLDGNLDIIVGTNLAKPNYVLFNIGKEILFPVELPNVIFDVASISIGYLTKNEHPDIIFGNLIGDSRIASLEVCPQGGGKLHLSSWCFGCPDYMGIPENMNGVCRECLPDHVQDPDSSETCSEKSCLLQKRPLGENDCYDCPAGFAYDSSLVRLIEDKTTWNNDRCFLCPVGEYVTPNLNCEDCPMGTFKNETSDLECTLCNPGKYQPELGKSQCEICPIGGYCDAAKVPPNHSGYIPCPISKYNNETGSSSEDDCKTCPDGQFAFVVDQSRGADTCVECPYPLSGSDCSICKEGYFLNTEGQTTSSENLTKFPREYCLECPGHGHEQGSKTFCPESTSIVDLQLHDGYWRDSENTSTVYKCPIDKACTHSNNSTAGSYCAQNLTGALCMACESDDHYLNSNGECTECPKKGILVLHLFVAMLVAILVAISLWYFMRKSSSLIQIILSLNIRTKFKTLVGFYQVMSSLKIVYGVEIHSDLLKYFEISNVLALEFFKLVKFQKDCFGKSAEERYVMNSLWPFLAFALILLCIIIFKIVTRSVEKLLAAFVQSKKIALARKKVYILLTQLSVILFYFALPIVSESIFDAKKCMAFETDDADRDSKRSYLVSYPNVKCDKEDKTYQRLDIWFWSFFTIWLVVFPLFLISLTMKIEPSIKSQNPSRLALACRFLWQDFDEKSSIGIYWDVLDTMRKILLTGFINFIDMREGSNKILRLIVAAIVSIIFVILLLYTRPYKRVDDLGLSIVANVVLTCTFVMSIILHLCSDENADIDGTCNLYVISGMTQRKASIIVTCLALGLLLLIVIVLVILTQKAPVARLRSTGYPPNLEMVSGCSFHFFMSHKWDGGQDQTHAITRTMQLLMPSLKIWLDVDELRSTDDLEKCINQTAVIIIFYSYGYFDSKNCRREFYQALLLQKPILVLYDDSTVDIQKIIAECKEHCENDDNLHGYFKENKERIVLRGDGIEATNTQASNTVDSPLASVDGMDDVIRSEVLTRLRILIGLFVQRVEKNIHENTTPAVFGATSDHSLDIDVFVLNWLKNGGQYSAESLKLSYFFLLQHLPFYKKDSHKQLLDYGIELPMDRDTWKQLEKLKASVSKYKIEVVIIGCVDRVVKKELELELKRLYPRLLSDHKGTDEEDFNFGSSSTFPLFQDEVSEILQEYEALLTKDIESAAKLETIQETEKRNPQDYSAVEALELSLDQEDNQHDFTEQNQRKDKKEVIILYLNAKTFTSKNIFIRIESLQKAKIPIVLVHERDASKDACEFGTFFEQVPASLADNLFSEIAVPLYQRPEYREVSLQSILECMLTKVTEKKK